MESAQTAGAESETAASQRQKTAPACTLAWTHSGVVPCHPIISDECLCVSVCHRVPGPGLARFSLGFEAGSLFSSLSFSVEFSPSLLLLHLVGGSQAKW